MAGVTNAPFRGIVGSSSPGLIYVNEMVMATAVVHGNPKTDRMMTSDRTSTRASLQVYGTRPDDDRRGDRAAWATTDRADHIDINFGCPAAKATRKGGGAAVPAKPNPAAASRAVGRAPAHLTAYR